MIKPETIVLLFAIGMILGLLSNINNKLEKIEVNYQEEIHYKKGDYTHD